MNKEFVFKVIKFDDYDFGFFPEGEEETYELFDLLRSNFPSESKPYPLGYNKGLMASIRTCDYNGMLFWSTYIYMYVHETEDSPNSFKFVLDENNKFVISPNYHPEKEKIE